MNWKTEVKVDKANQWSHKDAIVTMGSCFAEHIGENLQQYLFKECSNPFGITFNPLLLAKQITTLQNTDSFELQQVQKEEDVYFHYDFHSRFNHINLEQYANTVNQQITQAATFFKRADKLILTFGTAYYYEHQTFGLVNNCHKQPQHLFKKKRASVSEMFVALSQALLPWLESYPNREVVITVSPVRHWKDGVVENNRSKATLLLLCEKLCNWHDKVQYFPSYEIVMDELRDYRYYDVDMLHPNNQTTNYVWEKFVGSRFYNHMALLKKIKVVQQACQHKPFNVESKKHQAFVQNTLLKIRELKDIGLFGLDVLEEKMKKQLIDC